MSGGTGSGLFPQCRTFFLTYPMYACVSFAFPWGKAAAIGRPRLPLLTKGSCHGRLTQGHD